MKITFNFKLLSTAKILIDLHHHKHVMNKYLVQNIQNRKCFEAIETNERFNILVKRRLTREKY